MVLSNASFNPLANDVSSRHLFPYRLHDQLHDHHRGRSYGYHLFFILTSSFSAAVPATISFSSYFTIARPIFIALIISFCLARPNIFESLELCGDVTGAA